MSISLACPPTKSLYGRIQPGQNLTVTGNNNHHGDGHDTVVLEQRTVAIVEPSDVRPLETQARFVQFLLDGHHDEPEIPCRRRGFETVHAGDDVPRTRRP